METTPWLVSPPFKQCILCLVEVTLSALTYPVSLFSYQWRHNGRDSVSNHQHHDCFLNLYSDTDQRKNQSFTSLAFVRGIHRKPVNFQHKWPVTRKLFPIDDVIMPRIASLALGHAYDWRGQVLDDYCQWPNSLTGFSLYFKFDENFILLSCKIKLIATKFRIWLDSFAVVACVKLCSNIIARNRETMN